MELGRRSAEPVTTGFARSTLPYGVFSRGAEPRVGVAVGDEVLDVTALDLPHRDALRSPTLNPFLSLGPTAWQETRHALLALVQDADGWAATAAHRCPVSDVRLHLPFEVADYVDFYSSEHHAANVGRIFRPGQEPLPPNWRHLPIGYHGRAGTVVVSGTPVHRPSGQRRPDAGEPPPFGPTEKLDIEAELGFVVGVPSRQGEPVPVDRFAQHVFGAVVVNDWSARDIQAWESAPLGPFLGKSFATSISPWVVPLAALEAARVASPEHAVGVPDYLQEAEPWGLDIVLEVRLNGQVVSRAPFRDMYWSPAQQLAHLTANGASLRTGDLYASGTVSGAGSDELGSLLELTLDGTRPVALSDGSRRTYLEDGDEVVITATIPAAGGEPWWLGEVSGQVRPAR